MNVHFSGTAKRIVASIAAVAALGSMAACGSNGASNGGSDDELTVSYWDDEQDSIKEFIKQNPDIKVKEIRVPGDDYNTKLNQMIVGNTAPTSCWCRRPITCVLRRMACWKSLMTS